MGDQNDSADAANLFRTSYWERVAAEAQVYQWNKISWQGALICLPVMAGWIFGGIIAGKHRWTFYAVAGAVSVAFGAFQKLGANRIWAMIVLLLGTVAAIYLGNLAGHFGWYYWVILATVCGYAFGIMTLLGYAPWWLGLQWIVAMLVYGAKAYPPAIALENAICVSLGGASVLLYLAIFAPAVWRFFPTQDQAALAPQANVRAHLNPSSPGGFYALRVAVAMAASTLLWHFWTLPNGYWAPMTAAILLKPDFHEATLRGINRLLGTLVGAGAMTIVLALCKPNMLALGIMLLAAIIACLSFLRVNYALFVAFITAYVVLLFSLQGLPEPVVAVHRMEATLAGAIIALGVSLVPAIKARSSIDLSTQAK